MRPAPRNGPGRMLQAVTGVTPRQIETLVPKRQAQQDPDVDRAGNALAGVLEVVAQCRLRPERAATVRAAGTNATVDVELGGRAAGLVDDVEAHAGRHVRPVHVVRALPGPEPKIDVQVG